MPHTRTVCKKISSRRKRTILALLAVLGIVTALLVRGAAGDSPQSLKASDTCLEDIFSGNPEPLERLISPDSSFKAGWSHKASNRSLKLTCRNSTDTAMILITAEMRDGTRQDWLSSLKSRNQVGEISDALRFRSGTEAFVWDNVAAIYSICKPYSKGSSHTHGMKRPHLSVVATASGSAERDSRQHRTDLADVAVKLLYEAEIQTGCQDSFVPPSGAPKIGP